MEYVVSYKQSDTLLQLEDEGQLLVLNDLKCRVIHAGATVPISAVSDGNTHATPSHSPSTTIPHTTSQPHFDPNSTVMATQPHATTHTSTTTTSNANTTSRYHSYQYNNTVTRRAETSV